MAYYKFRDALHYQMDSTAQCRTFDVKWTALHNAVHLTKVKKITIVKWTALHNAVHLTIVKIFLF